MTASRYDLNGPNPIHQAAALRTLGFRVQCTAEKSQSSQGRCVIRWHVETAPADARELCLGIAPKDPARQRAHTLYRACMDALAIRDTLDVWLHSGADWYELTHSATPASATDPATPAAKIPRHLLDFTAACIAIGHSPRPRPQYGLPSLVVAATCGTSLPELGAVEAALQRRVAGGIHPALSLSGHDPDEHPFFYVRECLSHAGLCRVDEAKARRNPTGLFRGAGGRTALVSESIMAAGDRQTELVELHLTGQLA